MAGASGITIEEFERLPEALTRNHELVDGELVDVSGNTPEHNRLRDYLVTVLRAYVEEQRHLGLIISEQEYDFGGNAHGPDVSFISEPKCSGLNMKRRVQWFVPDMAIEIVANEKFAALTGKIRRYRQCGTKEVWLFSLYTREAYLYSDTRIAILGENDQFRPETIPGFSMRIGDLFNKR